MKPPAWVAAVTAYYRAVLDGKSTDEQDALLEKSRTIFARKSGAGFLEGETPAAGADTIDTHYPGHIGVPAGIVEIAQPERRNGQRPSVPARGCTG